MREVDLWRDYSASYVKNNRASGISIRVAALITAFLLSFLCSIFYNFWDYEVKKAIMEDGSWQGRFAGNVEEPSLLLGFYVVVLVMVSVSLILVIRGSFALSMNARIRQFGIFSSIGATPGQIRACLVQEAAMLCGWPILAGIFGGILLSALLRQALNSFTANIPGIFISDWVYHPAIFVVTFLATSLTVLFSAWLPAKKLSRLTPLDAIRNTGGLQLKKKKNSPVLRMLFGVEGELAGASLKAQKKAIRISALSLTLSFLGFSLILCFFTISSISTNYTYFERYQDAWDVMAEIKNVEIEDLDVIEELKGMKGDVAVYQKAEAICRVPQSDMSRELEALGGPAAVAGAAVSMEEDFWEIKAPIIVLDDDSFAAYCQRAGITPKDDGVLVLNTIWDSINSNFRYPAYLPFVTGTQEKIVLQGAERGSEEVEIPVLGYTTETPLLREEYQDYALSLFMPLSLWRELSLWGELSQWRELPGEQPEETLTVGQEVYVRVLADGAGEKTLSGLTALEGEVENILGQKYEAEIENRIQEKITNDRMILGYQIILGGLCVILALIGIANIFSNTLGFLRQRKREFARYMSVGMTSAGMCKMFCIEALVIAGRPILVTLPLTVAAVAFMVKASYLNPMEFIVAAPVIPMLVFFLVVFGFVALAYYLGGRKIMQCCLVEALRDDTID